jgi:TRAP-type C4-dicarboxylate transport system permease small subunit
MPRLIANIPKFVVAFLLVAAIVNLLVRPCAVMLEVTDWLDLDPIRFTWVEEVGEMMLAWLTLIGAAIGVRERTHFTLHVLHFSPATQAIIDRIHHVLIAGIGVLASWYGVKLCLLNRTLVTPGPDQPGALTAPPRSAALPSSTLYRWSSPPRAVPCLVRPSIEGPPACC